MEKEFVKDELKRIWEGSGYSRKSIWKWLDKYQTNGASKSFDESAGMFYFKGFAVFVSIDGYEICPIEGR